MPMRLEVSRIAERDLRKLGLYIAKDKPVAAMHWLQRIRAEFLVIQNSPFSFATVRSTDATFRKSQVGKYLIFYRCQGDVVRIERVIHGMRDLTRHIK